MRRCPPVGEFAWGRGGKQISAIGPIANVANISQARPKLLVIMGKLLTARWLKVTKGQSENLGAACLRLPVARISRSISCKLQNKLERLAVL